MDRTARGASTRIFRCPEAPRGRHASGHRHGRFCYLASRLGTVSAFAADGRLLWEKTAQRGSIFALGADPSYVYATHLSGQLAAFSRATGELMWLIDREELNRTTDETFLFPPVTDRKRVYVGGDIGAVYRLQVR